ncbi:MAG: 2-amino-4-hydroxy-6-hydroxymethyldihydropteridine diphosphokinase [Candidatus Eisenbacteria bacterium]
MVLCYIGLGSNIGDRAGKIAQAAACLVAGGDVVLRKLSSFYATRPWGYLEQDDFVNAAAEIETHLGAADLLAAAKRIELGLGRAPRIKWGPREIDIDILFYGDEILSEGDLTIPHPLVCERAFVLAPLVEIAPDLVDPRTGIKVSAYLEQIEKGGDPSWTSPAT